jgi:hypothetical protein
MVEKSQDALIDSSFVLQTGIKRKVTSYRLDESLAQWFKDVCRKQGQSTCHIIEALEYAYCIAYQNDGIQISQRPITINLKVERFVTKARRKGISYNEDIEVAQFGDLNECSECGSSFVTHNVGNKESPIKFTWRYVCRDCFVSLRKIYEVEFWKRV